MNTHAPPAPSDDLTAVLLELRGEFLASMPERFAEMRRALPKCTREPEARDALRRVAHRIAGTAETFGMAPLGLLADAIERYCVGQRWVGDEVTALSEALDLADDYLRAVHAAGAEGCDDIVSSDPRFLCLARAVAAQEIYE